MHELCHVAAWLIDGQKNPPHGPKFWLWANIAQHKIPSVSVQRCHSYSIHKPHKFECVECKLTYSRHTKKSIDIVKHRCGACKGKLEYKGLFNIDGTPHKTRAPSAFSLFVKDNFSTIKSNNKKFSHKEIMAELSKMFKGNLTQNDN